MKLEEQLVAKLSKPVASASDEELYHALVDTVKEQIRAREMTSGNKKLYYISAEFLTGRQLGRNLVNLRLYKEALELLKANGKDLREIEELEPEPSLGNGGLGRLAACFLDSIASLNLNGDGVGLRYHFGLFERSSATTASMKFLTAGLQKTALSQKLMYPSRSGSATVSFIQECMILMSSVLKKAIQNFTCLTSTP